MAAKRGSTVNYYDLLGVTQESTQKEVRYRNRIKTLTKGYQKEVPGIRNERKFKNGS